MLALFPEILFLAPFSALALRLTLAVLLSLAAWQKASSSSFDQKVFAAAEIAVAIALAAGVWTQAAALCALALFVAALFLDRSRVFPKSTILLAIVMCFSLLVTGPGALAFDLPL